MTGNIMPNAQPSQNIRNNMNHNQILSFSTFLLLSILFYHCTQSIDPAQEQTSLFPDLQVPEGYHLELAAGPEILDYPMFATLDETGRLFVFESVGNVYPNSQAAIDTPQFRIKLLVDEDEDGVYDRSTIFADGLSFPQGGVFYQGSLYATSAPDLLKLTDTDDDGIADNWHLALPAK
ncbi:MAG: hypothetical protein IPL46_15125 [Saprospiraceae bacterium]|nr:hypothetical protein [Saprospiraceae bacterium]